LTLSKKTENTILHKGVVINAMMNVRVKSPKNDRRSKQPERKPRDLNAYIGNIIGQPKNMYIALSIPIDTFKERES